jgi:hypothetical protein
MQVTNIQLPAIAFFAVRVLLPFSPFFAFLDVDEHLCCLLFARTRVNIISFKSPQHPLENMSDFRLEVVLVIVGPAKQSRNEILQIGSE